MKWPRCWPDTLLAVLVIALEAPTWSRRPDTSYFVYGSQWSSQRKLEMREKTRSLWYHGFNNYMTNAFPMDELSPLSCTGRGPDWEHPENFAYNDVSGNFSLTLIDVLDTFVVLDDRAGFDLAVRNVIDCVSFDVNTKPQVFETTIRVLGGLLSGHIFANQSGQPFHLPWYRGELLELAHDLGRRLLPAFATPTSIPYARLNLRHGVPKGETFETCTAGAGSLILEFATLSRLTGDDRFEKAAYKAFFALWNRKSDIGLVGNTINTWTGLWTNPEVTGIGAGIDSFYEYALKWYILSGEVEFLDVFQESYSAIMRYSRAADGFWYRSVNIHSGDAAYFTVDSLSAFWPGLQVLAGDVQNAIQSHQMYWNLWRRHSGLPEVWDINYRVATSFQYPLRPEFIESTWYLYRATRDPFYLDVGERILSDFTLRAKVDCGLTGIEDLRTNARDDRMDSFALSETLKYLFLLFDEGNPIHSDDSNYVFTTEGHILTLPNEHLKLMSAARRKMRREERHQCPVYRPVIGVYDSWENETGLVQGIRSRGDVDYARELVALLPGVADEDAWSPNGWCDKPHVDLFSYDFILSADGKVVPEDVNPSAAKLVPVADGFIVQNVTGIRTHIVNRLDGKGYDITKLGPQAVRTGQIVYVNDSRLQLSSVGAEDDMDDERRRHRQATITLRFFIDIVDPLFQVQLGIHETAPIEASVTGFSGLFGGDLSTAAGPEETSLRFRRAEGVRIIRDSINHHGCSTPEGQKYDDAVLLVHRGGCTFLEKLVRARTAGASGVVVISDEDLGLNPSAVATDVAAAGKLNDVAIVVLTRTTGMMVNSMADAAETYGMGQLMVTVDPERRSPTDSDVGHIPEEASRDKTSEGHRVLYLNGHPLLNTRLML